MIIDTSKASPLVSIVIPTYNRANLLKRAIESVLNQTYKNLEIIIVNDGSTDNTEEIVKEYRDFRIKYMQNSKNMGVSFARNTGIKNSKGDFIAFLDHDDEYLPEKIEKSLLAFKKVSEKIGMVFSNYYLVDKEKNRIFVKYTFKNVKNWIFPPPSTWMVPRWTFEKVGFFDEKFWQNEDTDFAIRFCKYFNFFLINEPLAVYHVTENSNSCIDNVDIEKLIKIRKLFLEKRQIDSPEKRNMFARYNYYTGRDLLRSGQIRRARKYLLKAFLTYPVKVEYAGKFLRSYFKNE